MVFCFFMYPLNTALRELWVENCHCSLGFTCCCFLLGFWRGSGEVGPVCPAGRWWVLGWWWLASFAVRGASIGRNLNVLYMAMGSPCLHRRASIQLCLNRANASIYLAVVENFSYFICRNCMVGAVHSISSLISVILIL